MGPMTTHEMRNDEEDDCVMLTTLIAVDEGSQLSKSASGSHSFAKKKKNTFVYKNSLENTLVYNGNLNPNNVRRKLQNLRHV